MKQIKIRYNGEFPNLCSGRLEVWVDDEYYNFGEYVLSSGGSVSFDADWNETVTHGKWHIDDCDFPENFPKELKDELLDVINREIPWGCCGGCV